jgi:ABC-type multidrug transport system fused ATPase/permease subunit
MGAATLFVSHQGDDSRDGLTSPTRRAELTDSAFPFWSTLWRYFHPWKINIMLAIGLNLVVGAAITIQTAFPKYLTDNILLGDLNTTDKAYYASLALLLYLFNVLVVRMTCYYWGARIFAAASEKMVAALRSRFFSHINYLCLRFHTKKSSGELFSYLFGSPLLSLVAFLNFATNTVPYSVFTLITTLALVGSWNLIMTGILFVCLLANLYLSRLAGRKIKALQKEFQEYESSISGETADMLRGTRLIKMMGLEDKVSEAFSHKAEQLANRSFRLLMTNRFEGMKVEGLTFIFYALLAWVGTLLFLENKITIGEVLGFLSAFTLLQGPLTTIFQAAVLKGSAQAGLNRIETVFTERTTTPAPLKNEPTVSATPGLAFANVSFSYEDRPTLHQVNFSIPYGQRVALVGPSGAGKSTVAALLLRLYDPNEGAILLDGHDLRNLQPRTIRRKFGIVPQEAFLFQATVRENVRVAKPDATDEDIIEALRRAAALDFVNELPQQLDTFIGEGGANLSGGQRQRMAIARALLVNPPIFIFDEATSALDNVSEHAIQETMKTMFTGRTAIIVAHRLSTIRFVDRILVFDSGRIVQDGSFRELSTRPGLFLNLLESQFQE